MASFKVGQRVRITAPPEFTFLSGHEATVTGPLTEGRIARNGGTFSGYPVDIDGHGRLNFLGHQIYVRPEHLAPLTDPGCEKFIASLDKLIREPNVERQRDPMLDNLIAH